MNIICWNHMKFNILKIIRLTSVYFSNDFMSRKFQTNVQSSCELRCSFERNFHIDHVPNKYVIPVQ